MLQGSAFNKATGKIGCLNLKGDIIVRENGANQILPGHTNLIEHITSLGNNVFYCSEDRVFSVDATASALKPAPVSGTTFTQKIDQLAANSHSVYAGSFDKNFSKISGDTASGFSQTATIQLAAKALSIGLDDENVYVLMHD